ncbi:endosomal/lysosomal proton channel TMEM175 isoform X2 [Hippopotamus amphibius kiboko]|uniref:endosomal/lysosomal proton channel TMEM175 isoform X2 n=1 Tax=Hippopotamus amphibius kiboko TaxID=575201 RepID=UPI002597C0FE|nr:endosomal/lysosomal proton channel TMEM175 isoform X2 [Hippopotamus amphibius kiboko]
MSGQLCRGRFAGGHPSRPPGPPPTAAAGAPSRGARGAAAGQRNGHAGPGFPQRGIAAGMRGRTMSGPRTPEPALDGQGDSPTGSRDEEAAGGMQCSQRMLSFSDALLSIIATVMILPVTHTEISPEQEFDRSVQKLLATRIAVYLMTFLIVTVAWAAHTRLFQVVGKIDDTLALLNLACMMTITFLPFTFSLMVTFPEVPLGIFLFCMCVIAIGAVQALIVVYAFHFPHLLSPQIAHSAHRTLYRRHILGVILPGPALCSAAAGFSLFCYPVSYLLMAAVIFLPYVSKAAGWGRARLGGPREPPAHSLEVFTFDLHEPLSKERVEAFSDGVYAIVATLLILDICEDNVPDAKDVKEKFQGSLVAALGASGPHFLAYFGSFATVGLLWFSHHSLFLHIRKATRPMGLLNTLSLAFVGGLPLAYQQTSAFARQPRDELESVRVSCAIIFLASIFQFAIWTTALLQEGETLQPSARFGGREHAFMFAKLALYPCASLLAFTCTCVLSRFSTAIFHAMQIAVPFTFLLLRLLVRLALAGLRGLRGLALPAQARPARGAVDGARSPLLPAPC